MTDYYSRNCEQDYPDYRGRTDDDYGYDDYYNDELEYDDDYDEDGND